MGKKREAQVTNTNMTASKLAGAVSHARDVSHGLVAAEEEVKRLVSSASYFQPLWGRSGMLICLTAAPARSRNISAIQQCKIYATTNTQNTATKGKPIGLTVYEVDLPLNNSIK